MSGHIQLSKRRPHYPVNEKKKKIHTYRKSGNRAFSLTSMQLHQSLMSLARLAAQLGMGIHTGYHYIIAVLVHDIGERF